MDRSALQAIVDRELGPLADRLHVGHWRITTCLDPERMSDRSFVAECGRRLAYDQATLYFDPEKHDDEAEVLDSLRHELLHVVLAPFDMLWRHLAEGLEGVALEQARTIWQFSCEQTVLTLERILRDLKVGELAECSPSSSPSSPAASAS